MPPATPSTRWTPTVSRPPAFPVTKTLDGFDVSGSSVTQATFDYLSSLEWIRAQHNLAVIGPPGIVDTMVAVSALMLIRSETNQHRRTSHVSPSRAPVGNRMACSRLRSGSPRLSRARSEV